MKRFFNTFVILGLMFSDRLLLVGAWIWLIVHTGWKAPAFGLLLLLAVMAKRHGPELAAKYAAYRMRVAMGRQP